MKKGLVSLAAFFLALAPAKANGIATINVDGKNDATVGETINVSINLQNIKDTIDGVVAIGGDLKFDDEYLEYVGSSDVNANYKIDINEKIFRIAGVDYTLENGIKEDRLIYTFSFKVLKEGNTTITFENAEVVDVDASNVESNVKPLNITINNKIEEEVKTPELETLEKEETLVVNKKNEKQEIKTNNVVKEVVEKNNTVEEIKEEIVEDNSMIENKENNDSLVKKIADIFLGFFNVIISIFK